MVKKSKDLVSIDFTNDEVRVLNEYLQECCFYGSKYARIISAVKRIRRAKEALDDCSAKDCAKGRGNNPT